MDGERGDKSKGEVNREERRKKKRGAQERERAKAFKRLLVTKLMGSFIPCFCSFTRSLYTLCRFALASVLNGEGRVQRQRRKEK